MGVSLEDYQQLLGDPKGLEIGTLHIERGENSGEEELAYVPGRPEDDPLFHCLRGELEGRLTGAIADLPDRERLVMTLYYYEEMTMREIGLALGVVESRVSQMHASAVANTILRRLTTDWSRRSRHTDETRSRIETVARRINFGCIAAAQRAPGREYPRRLQPGDVLRLNVAAETLPEWPCRRIAAAPGAGHASRRASRGASGTPHRRR